MRSVLEDRLHEDTRVTILGHVQRGGAPSAYDRSMSSILGYNAVEEVLSATADSIPQLIGIRYNRVSKAPLVECVAKTREVPKRIAAKDFDGAMALRGSSYARDGRHLHRDGARAAQRQAAERSRAGSA